MIQSFCCKETKKIWKGEISRRFAREIQDVARRKMRMINNAYQIEDLRIPPSNHLEMLTGNKKGKWSIRVNIKYRICFYYNNETGDAYDVELVDYHE